MPTTNWTLSCQQLWSINKLAINQNTICNSRFRPSLLIHTRLGLEALDNSLTQDPYQKAILFEMSVSVSNYPPLIIRNKGRAWLALGRQQDRRDEVLTRATWFWSYLMGLQQHEYKFEVAMSCSGCSGAVTRVLSKLEGE